MNKQKARSASFCQNNISKGSWTLAEDEKIVSLVSVFGKSWSKIAKLMKSRNGKQIRDRFINVLDPQVKKGKFSDEEDFLLVSLFNQYGPKWALISKSFYNRSPDMIKNRFHSSIKKKMTKLTRSFMKENKEQKLDQNNEFDVNNFYGNLELNLNEKKSNSMKNKNLGKKFDKFVQSSLTNLHTTNFESFDEKSFEEISSKACNYTNSCEISFTENLDNINECNFESNSPIKKPLITIKEVSSKNINNIISKKEEVLKINTLNINNNNNNRLYEESFLYESNFNGSEDYNETNLFANDEYYEVPCNNWNFDDFFSL